jgi:hypothetical protein
MPGFKKTIRLIFVLVSAGSLQAFSQPFNRPDSGQIKLKPVVHYTVGSSLTFAPHLGTFTGLTITSALSIPVNPKWTLEGGIVAGRYYSAFRGLNAESASNGSFADISLFGAAVYHVNPQFTVYGSGSKQLFSTSPYGYFPKNRYSIGSTYKFGNFSVGASFQMTTWDYNFSPVLFNGRTP